MHATTTKIEKHMKKKWMIYLRVLVILVHLGMQTGMNQIPLILSSWMRERKHYHL